MTFPAVEIVPDRAEASFRLWRWVCRFLLMVDECDPRASDDRWRTSALRIMLVACGLLATAVALMTFLDAVRNELWVIVAVDVASYVVLIAALALSARAPDIGALLLVGLLYFMGITTICFTRIAEVMYLGTAFLYLVPVVAWMFFGVGWACIAMAVNLLPYLYLLGGTQPILPFGIDMTLPHGRDYIHTLLFLWLNISIPFALFRVLKAINATSAERDSAFARLKESNALYSDMFEHAGGPTLICDREGVILEANASAHELLGNALAAPRPHLDVVLKDATLHDDPWTLIQLARTVGVGSGEFRLAMEAEQPRDVHLRLTQLRADHNLLVTLRDITGMRDAQRELTRIRAQQRHLEQHDLLTNLPNRHHLCALIDQAFAARAEMPERGMVAVASIRLNSVRQVNEIFDVQTGDRLILDFARLLLRATDNGIFLGRFSGVVFSMAFTEVQSPDALAAAIEALRNTLPRRLEYDGKGLSLGVSIGVAFGRGGSDTAAELVGRSERALELARKSPERPFTFFDEDLAREARRSIDIEMALIGAIERAEFSLCYQPKVRQDGEIESLEALLRWQSAELGPISPNEFIPIAERSGLIHAISDHVVEMACAQLRAWLDRFGRAWPVAINLSGKDLQREDISARIAGVCARLNLPVNLIQIEITETGLSENGELVAMHLDALARHGFAIGLDDFGTGYSSLAKLSEFPISMIKIDRSFVSGIGHHERREQIVRATLSLAQVLDCVAVAEGVETREQLAFLVRHGCELFQGYLFAQPLSATEIALLLEMGLQRVPGAGVNALNECND